MKRKTENVSASSSSDSDDSSSSKEEVSRKKHKTKKSAKRESSQTSTKYKEDLKKTKEDYFDCKKPRSHEKSSHHYHHHRNKEEDLEYNKKEKYRTRDMESVSSKIKENHGDRRNETDRSRDRKRSEGDKYGKFNDKERNSSRHYDRYERGNKYSNTRDRRDRESEEGRPSQNEGRPRGRYYDNKRGSNYSRGRRERAESDSFDHSKAVWGKSDQNRDNKEKDKPVNKEKPNFGLSGKLTEETNTYRGVVIKYSEPPEARKPKRRWRLYPFKGEKALQTLYIHRESAYLIGRDRKVVDLPVDHPSCSKQHAVLQYRLVAFTREDGTAGKRVRPYLIDLESANGTYINNKKIEPRKFVELLEKDVIKFGFSSREYVLLHENSKDDQQDDDVKQEEETAVKAEAEC